MSVALLIAPVAFTSARAGHEAPLYPSYYPQEIRIEAMDPATAGRLLAAAKIQAYIGSAPAFGGAAPDAMRFAESLGAYLVVRVNPGSPAAAGNEGACGVVRRALAAIAADPRGFTLHPYPVNGFHADYLRHADRAETAKGRLLGGPPADPTGLKLRGWGAASAEWDVSVEIVDAAALIANHRYALNGWLGPPWIKEGWFHAYLLLDATLDTPARERAAAAVRRLQTGSFSGLAERINAERDLVAELTAGCGALVAGYAAKREAYSAQYSDGVENVAWDSHDGLNAAIFLRTVKLKDFPWNGWLSLGVPAAPRAAWNPFGGFTDPAGRLVWSALGDPALFPEPFGAGWIMNRIGDVQPPPGR